MCYEVCEKYFKNNLEKLLTIQESAVYLYQQNGAAITRR